MIENKLQNRVNVIYLSDHGMVGVSPPNFIDITEFLANDTYDIYGSSPVLQIVPKDRSKTKQNLKKKRKRFHFFFWFSSSCRK